MYIKKILIFTLSIFFLFINICYGATFQKQRIKLNGGIYTLISVEVDTKDRISIVFPNKFSLKGTSTVNNLAKHYKASAAINGGFFKKDSQLPLGILYKDDTLLTGPLHERSALIKYKNSTYEIKNLSLKGLFYSSQEKVIINNLNQPRLSKNQVILYNEKWGSFIFNTFKEGKILLVRNNKIIGESYQKTYIPIDGYVVHGPKDKLKNFKVGDKVDFNINIPEISNLNNVELILGAGPRILKNRQIINTISEEQFTCTSICHNAKRSGVALKDGKLYLVLIPENISISSFSKILQKAGFEEAMNLDGGSSTQLYHKGINYVYGAPINNSLIIF